VKLARWRRPRKEKEPDRRPPGFAAPQGPLRSAPSHRRCRWWRTVGTEVHALVHRFPKNLLIVASVPSPIRVCSPDVVDVTVYNQVEAKAPCTAHPPPLTSPLSRSMPKPCGHGGCTNVIKRIPPHRRGQPSRHQGVDLGCHCVAWGARRRRRACPALCIAVKLTSGRCRFHDDPQASLTALLPGRDHVM
jgi:hypothetical protein